MILTLKDQNLRAVFSWHRVLWINAFSLWKKLVNFQYTPQLHSNRIQISKTALLWFLTFWYRNQIICLLSLDQSRRQRKRIDLRKKIYNAVIWSYSKIVIGRKSTISSSNWSSNHGMFVKKCNVMKFLKIFCPHRLATPLLYLTQHWISNLQYLTILCLGWKNQICFWWYRNFESVLIGKMLEKMSMCELNFWAVGELKYKTARHWKSETQRSRRDLRKNTQTK